MALVPGPIFWPCPPSLYLPALVPNLYLLALAPICIYQCWPPICIYQHWPPNCFAFFHKAREKDNIALKLPALFINDKEIERVTSIKFLGVLIDENLTWKEHITVIEIKISKNFDHHS